MNQDFHRSRTLKPRDERIIELVARGLRNEDIAREIGTTEHVVKNYLKVIYDKLGVWNRLELALWHVSRSDAPAVTAAALATKDAFDRARPLPPYRNIPAIKPLSFPKKPERGGLA